MGCKAVILAAGKGARLAPITAAVPKELLPLCGLPAIHHVVNEISLAGVRDVMLVISEGKESIAEYFTRPIDAKGERARRLESMRRELLSRVEISVAYQRELNGTAGAIRQAKDFAGKDDLLVAYPDDILTLAGVNVPEGPIETLLRAKEGFDGSVVLTRAIPGQDASQYGVVSPSSKVSDDIYSVARILEKPQYYAARQACVLIGRMLLTPACLRELENHPFSDAMGIIPALNDEAARGALHAVLYSGDIADIGSHEGYRDAVYRYGTIEINQE